MKKVFLIVPVLAAVLFSCKTTQVVSYNDDIYSSPSEEKRLARLAAEEKAKKDAEEERRAEEARLAQKAKDDANPYYQDPAYSQDDYYDYQYASRINRFNNPIYGAGYYDNYYTNSYYYNGNPSCYGTSIYSSYNYLMPSYQFGNYYNGLNLGIGYSWGNGWYNTPYCGYYNPYNSWYNPYSPWNQNSAYWAGYNQGYYNGFYGYPYYGNSYYGGWNNGWGYFNSYDVNSNYSNPTYAPRGSNGGGNSPRNSSAGMPVPEEFGERAKFINSVAEKQESTPRFSETPRPKVKYNTSSGTLSGSESPVRGSNGGNSSWDNSSPVLNSPNQGGTKGGWQNSGSSPVKDGNTLNKPRIRSQSERISNSNVEIDNDSPSSTNKSAGNSGWNSGGNWNSGSNNSGSNSGNSGNNSNSNSSPRGGNSGGGNRPR